MNSNWTFALLLLLVLAPSAPANTDADAVNERIPVAGAELEAHWQVDCARVRASLLEIGTSPGTGNDCPISADLRRELQLCAFIYQAPGGQSRQSCPDYQAAASALEAGGSCEQLAQTVRPLLDCSALTP